MHRPNASPILHLFSLSQSPPFFKPFQLPTDLTACNITCNMASSLQSQAQQSCTSATITSITKKAFKLFVNNNKYISQLSLTVALRASNSLKLAVESVLPVLPHMADPCLAKYRPKQETKQCDATKSLLQPLSSSLSSTSCCGHYPSGFQLSLFVTSAIKAGGYYPLPGFNFWFQNIVLCNTVFDYSALYSK